MNELTVIATIKHNGNTWVITLHERRLSPYLVYKNGLLVPSSMLYSQLTAFQCVFELIRLGL